MKGLGILIIVCLMVGACGSSNNGKSQKGKQVQLVNDEPDYMKDRRLEEYAKTRTNSHGTMGPGTGGSYGAYSYRQSALKAKPDTTQDNVDQLLMNDSIQDASENTWDDVDDPDLAADTADAGVSW